MASTGTNRCAAVREAFVETLLPHSTVPVEGVDDVARALAVECSREVAVALTTETGWTDALKAAICRHVAARRREASRLHDALGSELRTLRRVRSELDGVLGWLQSAAQRSLLECDFEDLRTKHDHLEAYCGRLERVLDDRQRRFAEPVGDDTSGRPYRTVVEALYADCDGIARYPVLSTAVRLYEICRGCQRRVRDHLIRRV